MQVYVMAMHRLVSRIISLTATDHLSCLYQIINTADMQIWDLIKKYHFSIILWEKWFCHDILKGTVYLIIMLILGNIKYLDD